MTSFSVFPLGCFETMMRDQVRILPYLTLSTTHVKWCVSDVREHARRFIIETSTFGQVVRCRAFSFLYLHTHNNLPFKHRAHYPPTTTRDTKTTIQITKQHIKNGYNQENPPSQPGTLVPPRRQQHQHQHHLATPPHPRRRRHHRSPRLRAQRDRHRPTRPDL